MKILSIDQARHGGWAIFDFEQKKLLEFGSYNFRTNESTFAQEVVSIEKYISDLIISKNISAVFIEDVHLEKNHNVFKTLSQLQGVLINLFEKHKYLYEIIAPSQWQGFCKAKGRNSKEIKAKLTTTQSSEERLKKKRTKIMSLEYVSSKFNVDTSDDNIADAICIGDYVVNNIPILINE